MDWAMDFLEPMTIEVDFHRKGKRLYSATTWAGYRTREFPVGLNAVSLHSSQMI